MPPAISPDDDSPSSNQQQPLQSPDTPQSSPHSQSQSRTAQASPATAPVKRRGAVACRRCRRLRSKCIHEKKTPPCEACRLAGPEASEECAFPRRGERDLDRQFRRRPVPADVSNDADGPSSRTQGSLAGGFAKPPLPASRNGNINISPGMPPQGVTRYNDQGPGLGLPHQPSFDRGDVLPPPDEIVEGCRTFVTSYFQLGFIPKAIFLESLARDASSVSRFLLTCILSISARFTPSLVRRYGSARGATDHFLDVSRSMVAAEMYHPSLERCQAFFLLAISQWGNGDRDRSSMDMGVAVRMAALLKLHSEETYVLDKNSPADQVVRSESARRLFWMIQSQENLHSGYNTPAPFPLEDITTLLPCDEADFAFGVVPTERAAVAGTPPAWSNPQLVYSPRRCLFATLIQAHGLWGKVARRAARTDYVVNLAPPWHPNSELQRTSSELRTWEDHLPSRHAFSVWNLRGWKSESLHLAYLSVTMVLRLSNIVTRRLYLDEILTTLTNRSAEQPFEPSTPTMANAAEQQSPSVTTPSSTSHETHGMAPPGFWARVSSELFSNVWDLHEQVDAYFSMRSSDEGFPQILVFCVYMCGSLASYLWRYPGLCPQLADKAELMARRSLEVLTELHAAWPTSSKWQKGLQQIATPLAETGHSEQEMPNSGQTMIQNTDPYAGGSNFVNQSEGLSGASPAPTMPEGLLGELINVLPNGNSNLARLGNMGNMQMNALPNELFDAELSAFLQGDFHYEFDGWQNGLSGG